MLRADCVPDTCAWDMPSTGRSPEPHASLPAPAHSMQPLPRHHWPSHAHVPARAAAPAMQQQQPPQHANAFAGAVPGVGPASSLHGGADDFAVGHAQALNARTCFARQPGFAGGPDSAHGTFIRQVYILVYDSFMIKLFLPYITSLGSDKPPACLSASFSCNAALFAWTC